MGYFPHDEYIELTMHFVCNLHCEHCMIEGTMDRLQPESMDRFHQVLSHNSSHGQWKGMILTGSEITLRDDLPELARMARAHRFEHVRIQTHGMRMEDHEYCEELVRSGVDQFFVSVTASDPETHDAITGTQGSFERMMRGLENLDRFEGVWTMTNTVVTKRSYRDLPHVVDRLRHLRRLVQMDFWNYWPMRESDTKDLVVSYPDVRPFLIDAIERAEALGRVVEVKGYPECLLGAYRHVLDNGQPKLLIDPEFWSEFMRNGFHQCVHREQCGSQQCLGLNSAYVDKFGWQAELLTPLPVIQP